ncbi:hypothetical protein [Cohnella caldifontis]|uniref:hypothetical protein n=1 Tax=Cohnella caldifontis TaxID=3027471 RepID=UPI0023EB6A05|nr:hypothetical protein [Cohnella sp. YIM B05605]
MKRKTTAAIGIVLLCAIGAASQIPYGGGGGNGMASVSASNALIAAAPSQSPSKRLTESIIQQAIDRTVQAGGGDVTIPAGKYYVEKTIVVKPSVTLRLNSGATLIPVRNVNVIELRSNSAVSGGVIYAYGNENFDKSAVYLDGSEGFSGTLKSASISDLKIIGPPGRGNGLFFYAAKEDDHVSWVQVTNLNITGFEKSIHLKTEAVREPDKIWINGNNFSQIQIKDSTYGIYIDGHRDLPYEISGNQFTNVQIQTNDNMKQAIYVKGTKNIFQAMIWDYHRGTVAVRFDEDSYRNQIQSNVSSRDPAYQDFGRNNLNLSPEDN